MANDRGARSPTAVLLGLVILLVGTVLYLAGRQIQESYGSILHEAGLVLIGTVLVAFCYEYVLRRQHDAAILKLFERSIVGGGPEFGLARIHHRIDYGAMFDQLGPGDELLWLDTYCPAQPDFQNQMIAALERGAHLRMLAIAPDCPTSRMRAIEIAKEHGFGPARFTLEAQNNIDRIYDIVLGCTSQTRKRVELRLYDDLPCIPMYIRIHRGHPHSALTGYFLRDPSFNRPHLEWRWTNGPMLDDFYLYFQTKWERFERNAANFDPSDRSSSRDDDDQHGGGG